MAWWEKLKSGLKKSADTLNNQFSTLFKRRRLDKDMLDELEEIMILSDFGAHVAKSIRDDLAKEKLDQDVLENDVKEWIAQYIAKILEPVAIPLELNHQKPHVIFVIGVNGAGKTTNIAKIAHFFKEQGKNVHVAACDTFRAAAKEQLQVWANRVGFTFHTAQHEKADAAALAFDALKSAKADNADLLLIDTAGRLHTKTNLMDEMKKIVRVLQKLDESVPHTTLLVLDATTGQNALLQVEEFKNAVPLQGLVLTKLDGTAKGGIIVAISKKYNLPIYFIGVGESVVDLNPFTSIDFARNLLGVGENQ
ncbi:MAG: Signal recognition particle receptor FtsY [Holosporales bacterium]